MLMYLQPAGHDVITCAGLACKACNIAINGSDSRDQFGKFGDFLGLLGMYLLLLQGLFPVGPHELAGIPQNTSIKL